MRKPNSVNHQSKVVLKILFKEILEQITPEDAEKLTGEYRAGRQIGFRIKQNSRGIGYKTAFQPFSDDGVEVKMVVVDQNASQSVN
jgi:hypothetical protein